MQKPVIDLLCPADGKLFPHRLCMKPLFCPGVLQCWYCQSDGAGMFLVPSGNVFPHFLIPHVEICTALSRGRMGTVCLVLSLQ